MLGGTRFICFCCGCNFSNGCEQVAYRVPSIPKLCLGWTKFPGCSCEYSECVVKKIEFVKLSAVFNPLKPELNPICYLLALLEAHNFLHVSRIRVKILNFRLLMSYIYMEHPFLMFLDHTQRRTTVGRTPLDE